MSNLVKFIVGGKEYSINPIIFQNIVEEKPSYLPILFANEKFKKQDVYDYPERDPEVFEAVLRYYRTKGMFTIGTHLQEQPDFVKTELDFWGISVPEEPVVKKTKNSGENITEIHANNKVISEFTKHSISFLNNLIDEYKKFCNGAPIGYHTKFTLEISDRISIMYINPMFLENLNTVQIRKNIYINTGYFIVIRVKKYDFTTVYWPYNNTGYKSPSDLLATIHVFANDINDLSIEQLEQSFDLMDNPAKQKDNKDNKDNKGYRCNLM